MLDGVSLDQLRTFIAAADEGSFSAAGRRLRRAQSVVSQTLANLEGQLGVKLFDRRGHLPVLTDQGRALLADARTVAGHVDLLKARAKSLAGGLEPELSVAVDVMFPDAVFTAAVAAFQKEFPATLLRFDMESSAVMEPVLDGRCAVGIVGSWALLPPQLTHEPLLTISVRMVAAAQHPLAARRGQIPLDILAKYIQITHIDPCDMSGGSEPRLKIPRVWRLSHLGAKLAFLRAGFGFGGLPLHLIEEDLASGKLVEIITEDAPRGGRLIEMWVIYRTDSPPGPAGRWFIDRLRKEQATPPKLLTARLQPASVPAKSVRRRLSSRSSASKSKRGR
ncbi:MAG TPA: LysR family transcriptional regulator [Steroidobacteraceae bacterium]|jgi:DNA-binding transcriptional LysR family regulator|nr:LysR family transcriptional regulator [Steroidobacteraceae bacterium]